MDTIPQDDVPHKRCTGPCGQMLPATPEFFQRDKAQRDGLYTQCKVCKGKKDKAYRARPEVHEHRLALNKEYDRERRYRNSPRKSVYQEHSKIREQEPREGKVRFRDPEAQEQARQRRLARYRDDSVYRERVQARMRIYALNRYALKKSIPGTHTAEQIADQLKRQKYRCYYGACGHAKFKRVKENGQWRYIYEVEHTFPISRMGGTDIPANDMGYIVLACPSCNSIKRDRYPWEWPEGGRLL